MRVIQVCVQFSRMIANVDVQVLIHFLYKLPVQSRVGDLHDPVSLTSRSSGKGLSVAWFSGDIQSLPLLPQVGNCMCVLPPPPTHTSFHLLLSRSLISKMNVRV